MGCAPRSSPWAAKRPSFRRTRSAGRGRTSWRRSSGHVSADYRDLKREADKVVKSARGKRRGEAEARPRWTAHRPFAARAFHGDRAQRLLQRRRPVRMQASSIAALERLTSGRPRPAPSVAPTLSASDFRDRRLGHATASRRGSDGVGLADSPLHRFERDLRFRRQSRRHGCAVRTYAPASSVTRARCAPTRYCRSASASRHRPRSSASAASSTTSTCTTRDTAAPRRLRSAAWWREPPAASCRRPRAAAAWRRDVRGVVRGILAE